MSSLDINKDDLQVQEQLQHAIASVKEAQPSKWHIHETFFATNIAEFQPTESKSTRNIVTMFLKAINNGYIGPKSRNFLIGFSIDTRSLECFELDNVLSLHMKTFGSRESFSNNTKNKGKSTQFLQN